jgi:hypothetical protein
LPVGEEGFFVREARRILFLSIFVLVLYACIPIPVPVDTGEAVYNDYGSENPYAYGDEAYYNAPVVYGEPCYFTPQVSVTFAYDYFTYELVHGYVDIAFWRGGHRIHRQPWYEHGKRMSHRDVLSGYHHKVRASELNRHREMLRKHHQITHPDSFYGVRETSRMPADSRPSLDDQNPSRGYKPPRTEEKSRIPDNFGQSPGTAENFQEKSTPSKTQDEQPSSSVVKRRMTTGQVSSGQSVLSESAKQRKLGIQQTEKMSKYGRQKRKGEFVPRRMQPGEKKYRMDAQKRVENRPRRIKEKMAEIK